MSLQVLANPVDITAEFAGDAASEPHTHFLLRSTISEGTDPVIIEIADKKITLENEAGGELQVACSQKVGERGTLAAWVDGKPIFEETTFGDPWSPEDTPSRGELFIATDDQSAAELRMDSDFTTYTRFRLPEGGRGTLFSKSPRSGKWIPDAKALFVRGGRLVYDIGWRGDMTGGPKVDDGEWHHAVLKSSGGNISLHLDGHEVAAEDGFTEPDPDSTVFKVGAANDDFGLDFTGEIRNLRFWKRALDEKETELLATGRAVETNTPLLNWKGSFDHAHRDTPTVNDGYIAHKITVLKGTDRVRQSLLEPLADVSHMTLVSQWDHNALDRGATIYNSLCITCHGTVEKEGFLPTALRFHSGEFKNGSDPLRMYQTLTKGFGQMVPQTWMTPRQKYDVIHYIRETSLREHNPSQLVEIDDAYLSSLPVGFGTGPDAAAIPGNVDDPHYKRMDFGPFLFWTYQVDEDNIAYKGLAVRLDPGPGGVSKGRAWMIYDHDTMRVAAAYTGDKFVDWRGIAFDGSHGTHTSIAGDRLFVNPVGPGVANPGDRSWEDPRIPGRDNKPYGPLPRDWTHYKGLFIDGEKVVLRYTVGATEVLESPGFIDFGETPIFTRTFNIGSSEKETVFRLAPESQDLTISVSGSDAATIDQEDGFALLRIPPSPEPASATVLITRATTEQISGISVEGFANLNSHTRGGPTHWPDSVVTESKTNFDEGGPFAVDCLTVPDENPWNAHMQMGGFDFHPEDPNKAAICTWLGDVWLVEGIAAPPPAPLHWKRVATGMFQPLGLKYRDGEIFVTCRDQLARIHDLNGDGETDYIESFNNDHQVTEHFHEFAMGLQTDDDGNFYYAKSARHALTALVPHHGTLLKVTQDGLKTEILANGFRAANGVCLNPDGTFIVTDQEGHWNPKNRINYVRPGGFYGNMFGHHNVTDSSNEAMEQPLCWITNDFDRSPAELLWVPENSAWKPLTGTLLNLSYGYGQVYVVPHEIINGQAQGGMCALPIPRNETGIMRGRFSPADGQLYTCGLFSWAGSQQKPGGFYRIRYTGNPVHLPTHIEAKGKTITITLSGRINPKSAEDLSNFQIRAWNLKRSKNYGSRHYDERALRIESVSVSVDRHQITLTIPELSPTWGMSINYQLETENGTPVEGIIHNSIHHLTDAK